MAYHEVDPPVDTAAGRYYRNPLLGGALSPSVTTVLHSANLVDFSRWSVKQAVEWMITNQEEGFTKKYMRASAAEAPLKQRDLAGDIGTEVHDLIWRTDRPQVDEMLPEVANGVAGWDTFVEDFEVTLLSEEERVAGLCHPGDKLGYAGTYDSIVALPDGRQVILDLKTSNSVSISHALQVAAYWQALPGYMQIDEGWIVQVDKYTVGYEIYPVSLWRAWNAFQAVHEAYRLLNDSVWES